MQKRAAREGHRSLHAERGRALRPPGGDLEAFFETAVPLFCIASIDGYFLRVNAAFERVLGYSSDELVSRPYLGFVHPADLEETRAMMAELSRGEDVGSFENRYRCKDGTYRWLLWSAAPAPEEGLVYATARDNTRRRGAEELVLALNDELEAFSYSVSHDLRAPLRAISGFAQLLAERHGAELSDEGRNYLDRILTGSGQMDTLIDGLLRLSRVGRQALDWGPVSLDQAVAEALAELEADRAGRSLEIEIGPLPEVKGDRALLRQVFSNLLSNAFKYTQGRDPARVEVGSRDGDGPPVIFVRDNGVGFDMRYAEKVFHTFERLHRAEEFEGIGLGLALVNRIVMRHGGRIWVDAAPGEGAMFSFTLSEPHPGSPGA